MWAQTEDQAKVQEKVAVRKPRRSLRSQLADILFLDF